MSLPRPWRLGFCSRIILLGLFFALPWIALDIGEHFLGRMPSEIAGIVYFLLVLYSILLALLIRMAARDPFMSLANLVQSLRGGDYSQRIITLGRDGDPVAMLEEEVNLLVDALRSNRLARMEDTFLLQNLIDKLDLAVAVFDGSGQLSMANPAFGRLQDRPISILIGMSPQELGLAGALKVEAESAHWMDFPGRSSRFLVHRTEFRQGGQPRVMVLLSDLKNPLREEERTAWKRLIRVMGHELNNSLTPVISLAESLSTRLEKLGMEGEDKTDFAEALSVIESRAVHLNHFMQDYSRLAKLPEPRREAVPVAQLAQRVAQLENDTRLEVTGGPDCVLSVDPAQVENLLINVLKNALEAAGEGGAGKVSFGWRRGATEAILWIDDNGPGLSGTENLFVPFYSTKREGSGIGLVLSREIAEANGGNLTLANRPEGGCRATVVLPLYQNEIPAVSE